MRFRYRLKRQFRKHEVHKEWNTCNEEEKKQIEKASPNRFDFENDIKSVIPPAAISEPKKRRAEKEKEDK